MINLTTCNEWQRMDPELNIPQPWYTFPALDEICTWDLSDKSVLEIGGGASTVWWNARCKEVRTIETNKDYASELRTMGFDVQYTWPNPIHYYDIIIVDNDGDRDENIDLAFKSVSTNGVIIIDNYDQESMIWQPSIKTKSEILKYKHKIFKQLNHETGWKTIIIWMRQ